MSRLELFKGEELVDTVHVHRYSVQELNELLVEMGQFRDETMTWEKINAASKLDSMLNNWQAYHDITITDEERKAEEQAKTAGAQSEEL